MPREGAGGWDDDRRTRLELDGWLDTTVEIEDSALWQDTNIFVVNHGDR